MNKEEFIDEICVHIAAKAARPEIRREIGSHIDELMQNGIEAGLSAEEAEKKAVAAMGSAEEIGISLNKQHRPKTEWLLLLTTAAAAAVGIALNLSPSTLTAGVAGCIILIAAMLFDYTLLKRHAVLIYVGFSIFLLAVALMCGGYNSRLFFISSPEAQLSQLAPVLFAGVLAAQGERINTVGTVKLIILLAAPFLAIAAGGKLGYAFLLAGTYIVMFAFLSFKGGKVYRRLLAVTAGISAVLCLAVLIEPYRLERLTSFFTGSDPMGSGYLSKTAGEVIKGAAVLGAGSAKDAGPFENMNEYSLLSILNSFGWIAAAAVILLVSVLVVRLFAVSGKIKSRYGHVLAASCSSLLCIKFFYNILMNLNLLPPTGINMPLISRGGTDCIISMFMIGLVLSVYRRNNILGPDIPERKPGGSKAARLLHKAVDALFEEC